MRVHMSVAVRNNMFRFVDRYCCKGRYSVNIHLKCMEKEVVEFDHDWGVATLYLVYLA